MTKMVMIVYNEALDIEAVELLEKASLENYTKIMSAYGRGETSGAHLGNDIWPGRNNILYIACSEKESARIVLGVKGLRAKFGREGIKALVFPIEDLT